MFNRKRFRSAIAIIITLLLTVALASIVSAQTPPPPQIDDGTEAGPTPEPPGPGPVLPTPDTGVPPTPEPPTTTPDDGMDNGMDNGTSAPPSDSWPPPNAIVHHAATPIQISALAGGLNVYIVGPDGTVISGPVLDSISDLAEAHPSGDAVSLYSGTNPGSGKSIEIDYLPNNMTIRVSTFYADKPPHDFNKPYVFIVDADHSVTHERW